VSVLCNPRIFDDAMQIGEGESMTHAYDWLEDTLATIHRANWYRSVQSIDGQPGASVSVNGQSMLNFASNDYLGLASDERIKQAAIAAIQEFGTGSTGSRLITGHRSLHAELEKAIAQLKQTEDALVFSSGYLANLGAIATLVGARDLILSDLYNHSSLKMGSVLSKATVMNYPHNDVNHLRRLLEQHRSQHRRCLITTDTVFSMDGDLCPLPELLNLAEEFACMVLVDEAHATGVLGATGAGCVEHLGCTGRPLVQVGTLSKALGSLGGYVAGSAALIDVLRNRAPSWIYTTGLSPADTAAALAAIAIVQQEPERRSQLWQNVHALQTRLETLEQNSESSQFQRLPSDSPIICLQVKDAATVVKMGQALKSAGILAGAIRPPTVPTSRLRFTIMATHTPAMGDRLLDVLQTL
jgi:8-amino-7-oxononanoate synthase